LAVDTQGSPRTTPAPPAAPAAAPAGLSLADAAFYRAARVHAQEGRPAEAIAAYVQLVRRDPDLVAVWSELGGLYSATGETGHALASYQHVVRLRPGDALAWYNVGALTENQGRHAEAVPAFREALRLDPKMALAWHGLASAQRGLGQHKEALFACQQAVRFDPELAPAWLRLGNLHEHYEEYQDAIRAYREAVRARRYYPLAWYSLAVLCREEGQFPEAVSAFLECLRLKPHDTDAWVGLGITYAKLDNRAGVRDVCQELAMLDPEAAETFGRQYVENWTPSRQTPRRMAAGASRSGSSSGSGVHPLAETWYEMGVLHRRQGETGEAISDFREAVRFDPDHVKAWFSLAVLYLRQSREHDALHALREILRLKPRLAAAWHQLGQIHVRHGQHEKALKAYRKLVQIKPRDVAAWLGLGRACIAVDYTAGLAEVMETLRLLHPDSAERLAREYADAVSTHEASSRPAFDPRRRGAGAEPGARPPGEELSGSERSALASFDAWVTSLRASAQARAEDVARLPLARGRDEETPA
jgi:tetratricopeptide (TPR) repeat protein